MSGQLEKFNQNIARVDNLCNIFEAVKVSPKRPTVKEGDVLRAAVVFLHSALENYLRSTLAEWLPRKGDKKAIDGISLPTSDARAEKFFLGALLEFSGKSVDDLISESVQKHMTRVTFNDFSEICAWLKKININLTNFSGAETINTMIKRRHKIVHETDANRNSGSGNHYAASINLTTVKSWEGAVCELVQRIEQDVSTWR